MLRDAMSFSGQTAIIAGSGMYTDDRIVNRLKHGLYDPKNDLFFVGYQPKAPRQSRHPPAVRILGPCRPENPV